MALGETMKRNIRIFLILITFPTAALIAEPVFPGLIISDQTFNFRDSVSGDSVFIPVRQKRTGLTTLRVFVQSSDLHIQELERSFPNYEFAEIAAVSFQDINRDGNKDIIIIADFMTGIGPNGAKPFPLPIVYLRLTHNWMMDEEFSNTIQLRFDDKLTIQEVMKLYREYLDQSSH